MATRLGDMSRGPVPRASADHVATEKHPYVERSRPHTIREAAGGGQEGSSTGGQAKTVHPSGHLLEQTGMRNQNDAYHIPSGRGDTGGNDEDVEAEAAPPPARVKQQVQPARRILPEKLCFPTEAQQRPVVPLEPNINRGVWKQRTGLPVKGHPGSEVTMECSRLKALGPRGPVPHNMWR